MLNSKVIDILKTFSSGEMKRFGEFLNSPFHNKNKKAIILFDLISKYHPLYENKNLTKENLFVKLFPSEKRTYSDASVRNLFSDLMILAERYLAVIRFENDKFDFNEKILREITDRKLTGIFDKKIRMLSELTDPDGITGEDHFYRKFILEEIRSSNRQYSDNLKLFKDSSLIKASEYLSFFYLIKMFKLVNFMEFQKLHNINNDSNFAVSLIKDFDLDRSLKIIETNAVSEIDVKVIKVYYKMYRSIVNFENDDRYFDFKNSLLENDNLFSKLERLGLYICLTNSCVKKIDSGKKSFTRECFDIYTLMLDHELYSAYPGYFPMSAFCAILHTGLSSGEFKKIEDFINSYSSRLNPEHISDAVNYSMAHLSFYKKDFGKALECIIKTDSEFSQFKFLLKILTLKIYYETGDFDSLYYSSDSFQHFLNNNKLVGERYRSEFTNFIKALDLLVRYRSGNNEHIRNKLEHLFKSKSMAGKKWLVEKFNEIRK